MIFSYNWLQSFFSKKLPKPEEIAEVLTIYSFEAKVLKETRFLSGTKDIVLDIDILPNRAHDCYSHLPELLARLGTGASLKPAGIVLFEHDPKIQQVVPPGLVLHSARVLGPAGITVFSRESS